MMGAESTNQTTAEITMTHAAMTNRVVEENPWKVLIPQYELARRIREVAQSVQEYIKSPGPDTVLIIVSKGGIRFGMELVKFLDPTGYRYEIVGTSSYGGGEVGGKVNLEFSSLRNVEGYRAIIVDDIGDRRKTLQYLNSYLKLQKHVAEIKNCVMLNKPDRCECPEVMLDWIVFNIPNTFVAGFGLDGGDEFEWTRNYPEIRYKEETLEPSVKPFWVPKKLPA